MIVFRCGFNVLEWQLWESTQAVQPHDNAEPHTGFSDILELPLKTPAGLEDTPESLDPHNPSELSSDYHPKAARQYRLHDSILHLHTDIDMLGGLSHMQIPFLVCCTPPSEG